MPQDTVPSSLLDAMSLSDEVARIIARMSGIFPLPPDPVRAAFRINYRAY